MDYEFYVYDQIMYGNFDLTKSGFFKTKQSVRYLNEPRALKVMRYAVEGYLGWLPEEAYEKLNETVVSEMSLQGVMPHISFPIELEPNEYYRYIVSRLYPERYPYRMKDSVISYYKRILSGEVSSFKNGFFVGASGNLRVRICLEYVLLHLCNERFKSIEDMYLFFAKSGSSNFFKEYKLFSGFRDQFEFPLDVLHFSLPAAQRDEQRYLSLRRQLGNTRRKNTPIPSIIIAKVNAIRQYFKEDDAIMDIPFDKEKEFEEIRELFEIATKEYHMRGIPCFW